MRECWLEPFIWSPWHMLITSLYLSYLMSFCGNFEWSRWFDSLLSFQYWFNSMSSERNFRTCDYDHTLNCARVNFYTTPSSDWSHSFQKTIWTCIFYLLGNSSCDLWNFNICVLLISRSYIMLISMHGLKIGWLEQNMCADSFGHSIIS